MQLNHPFAPLSNITKPTAKIALALGLFLSLLSGPLHAAEAKEASSEIPAKRDFPLSSTALPCVDFHQYVCSNVEASFKLREDRSAHDFAFNDSSERILAAKKSFFQNIDKEKKLSDRDQQVKDFYSACMNEKQGIKQEKQSIKKMQKTLAGIKSMADFFSTNIELLWQGEEDAADYLSLISLLHRKLDGAVVTGLK